MRQLCLLVALCAAPAFAQDQDCPNAQSQSELNQCAYDDWQAQDVALNAVWVDAMAVMKAIDADLPEEERGAAAHLRAGQKAWITFRDESCAAEGFVMRGGSAEPMLIYGCMARLTEARTEALNMIAEADY